MMPLTVVPPVQPLVLKVVGPGAAAVFAFLKTIVPEPTATVEEPKQPFTPLSLKLEDTTSIAVALAPAGWISAGSRPRG